MDASLPLEIERKYLIAYPDVRWLSAQPGIRRAELSQTYLLSNDGSSRRVRKWEEGGKTVYIRGSKQALTDMTRVEIEDEIPEESYLALLAEADPERRPIEKTRWLLPYAGHTLEIDLYPFWTDRATLECELKSEEESFDVPSELKVILDVTGDRRYLNSALAREVPYDPLPEDLYPAYQSPAEQTPEQAQTPEESRGDLSLERIRIRRAAHERQTV